MFLNPCFNLLAFETGVFTRVKMRDRFKLHLFVNPGLVHPQETGQLLNVHNDAVCLLTCDGMRHTLQHCEELRRDPLNVYVVNLDDHDLLSQRTRSIC